MVRGVFFAVVTAVDAWFGVAVAYTCPVLRRSGLGSPFSQRPIRLGPLDSRPRHFCIRPRPTAGGAHPGPAEGPTDGGSAGAGGGHTRKRQVDVDVLALLREWELEDESERLAENGVCKMDDLEYMKEGDVHKFGLRLKFRGLLQHLAKQKKGASDGSKEHKAAAETKVAAEVVAEAEVKAKLAAVGSAGTFECKWTLYGHSSRVTSVAWSNDGSKLATGSWDETVRIWSVGSDGTYECQSTLNGHSSLVSSVCFSPDGKQVASGSWDRTVKIWQASTGKCQSTLSGHSEVVHGVCFSPDGSKLASCSYDCSVKIWNLITSECVSTLSGHSKDNPDCACTFYENGNCKQSNPSCPVNGHSGWVFSVAFSPDGKHVASASGDKTVKMWETSTGKCQSTLTGHSKPVFSVVYSPDGTMLASGSGDKTLKIWNAQTGQCVSTLSGHSNGVLSVAWSPDGTRIASGSFDSTVKLWNAGNFECQSTLSGHSNDNPDCTCHKHGYFRSNPTCPVNGHSDGSWSVAWSPDGAKIASGSNDKTIKIWSTNKGRKTKRRGLP